MTPDCGTRKGYELHLRDGETPCRPCKDAEAKRSREWRRNVGQVPAGPKRADAPRDWSQPDLDIVLAWTVSDFNKARGYDPTTRTYS